MLEIKYSRLRQQRLCTAMAAAKWDAVIVGLSPHVYYLSAALPFRHHHGAVVLSADGRCTLIWANQSIENAAADAVLAFEANSMGTLRLDQPAKIALRAIDVLRGIGAKSIGIDRSAVSLEISRGYTATYASADDLLHQLRRPKDPDELGLLRKAIAATDAMHAKAREIVAPGVDELFVYNSLHAAAVESLGEPMTSLLGNDYACGSGGGPPRQGRTAKAGEMYIFDLGPAYRGYWADNTRALAVGGKPTDVQWKAWYTLVDALKIVEQLAKPGVRCQEIVKAVDEHLKSTFGRGLSHHLGHGVGLSPHEFPHLNPSWDDVLQEGEVFAAEPALYRKDLAAGLRLEDQYLMTSDGVENLVSTPRGMT